MLHAREIILLSVMMAGAASAASFGVAGRQGAKAHSPANKIDLIAGKDMFIQYCASCHGVDGRGDGPAAIAMRVPPTDLTQLSRRHEGIYPEGYIGAVVKFGKSLAAHGSQDMPVWGKRFRAIDRVRDPTGQRHVDDLVAYIETLQTK